jgi:hypothetical protein
MLPASTTEKGECAAYPNTCKTPAGETVVLLPYANHAALEHSDMNTVASTVFIVGKNAVTENSEIVASSGDEAGVDGGVISGTVSGSCRFRLGSSAVSIEGYAVAYSGTLIGQNGANANAPSGIQVSPSQARVFVEP